MLLMWLILLAKAANARQNVIQSRSKGRVLHVHMEEDLEIVQSEIVDPLFITAMSLS